MTWYSSWIASLPSLNLTIPASVQGRFISFVLKKTLGHLLKPGQLNHHQIDSQIGSGYVQVNDLELDPEAFNTYLHDLPIVLLDGTVSSVKARIPWPNPLASTLGFSLKSIHLVFQVVPSSNHIFEEDIDLAGSVTSMAESFLHEELSPREEASLWQSLHPEMTPFVEVHDDCPIPGGLDDKPTLSGDERLKLDTDPAGISMFATLIERLLARFEFDAEDIKVTLIQPGNLSMTVSLDEIRYHTQAKPADTVNAATIQGETRTLSALGFMVTARNLDSQLFPLHSAAVDSPHSVSPATSRPPSRTSSNSSIDEETEFAMSQSLAFLPSRQTSPSSSMSSSMYQSAISSASVISPPVGDPYSYLHNTTSFPKVMDTTSPTTALPSTSRMDSDETLISLGSLPIMVELTTPSPLPKMSGDDDDDPFLPSAEDRVLPEDTLQITISAGVIACALQPWHIHGLLRLTRALTPQGSKAQTRFAAKPPSIINSPPMRINAQIRAIVLLLVPSMSTGSGSPSSGGMLEFFDRPMVPPPLRNGYTRIYLDTVTGCLNISSDKELSTSWESPTVTPNAQLSSTSFKFTVTDMSIFLFDKSSESLPDDQRPLSAFPLLLMDPQLVTQYPSSHFHPQVTDAYPQLPTFDIIDWTKEESRSFGTKLSHWRTRQPRNGSTLPSSIPPAIQLSGQNSVAPDTGNPGRAQVTELDVQVGPLHIRVDFGKILQHLSFVEELLQTQPSDHGSSWSESTVDEYANSKTQGKGKERARQRLDTEMTPFDDLDCNLEGNEEHPTLRLAVAFPIIRFSVRCPPPPNKANRSGALVVDLHGIRLSTGTQTMKPPARFAMSDSPLTQTMGLSDETILMKVQFRRAVIACSLVGANTASAFVSIGPLMAKDESSPNPGEHSSPLEPRISVIKPNYTNADATSVLALSVDVPSVHGEITKSTFDALQYWADDVAQLFERAFGQVNYERDAEVGDSRNPSLIGSRFFAKSRSGSALSARPSDTGAERVVKLTITETFLRVMVPRGDNSNPEPRPFDVKASDLDVLIELNPESKQQTILNVGIMDLAITNTSTSRASQTLFNLTSPRSLSATPKSIIKLQFSTAGLPETHTKETRIKLTMSNFTYTLFPELQWVSDLAIFAKNPPGTFEAVIPSDRTRISVKILDGSLRAFAPKHPGALVSYIQELEFSTDVIGDSRDSSFRFSATGLNVLAIDEHKEQGGDGEAVNSLRGISTWTATGYALLAEVMELEMSVVNQMNASPLWKVVVDRVVLRSHLCADTLNAVTAFSQDLGSLFKSPEEQIPRSFHAPEVFNGTRKQGSNIMSSVEDLAFKRLPDVGHSADMIYDDLPTNLDYLDESFGTAAGLREFRDEDLDEFDDEELEPSINSEGDGNTVSKIGGETIKVFERQGLAIVEDYYMTIPPDASHSTRRLGDPTFSIQILDGSFNAFLYDGYDWAKTRRAIEEEVKEMRKRLAKIRQLVANGQMQDPNVEDTSALLFNSVYIGLEQDEEALGEPAALLAAIDEELRDDLDTASQSSWQSLKPSNSNKPLTRPTRVHGKRLTRSRTPSIEFCASGLRAEIDQYQPDNPLVSRTFVTVKDLEILDHIKTSTWKKFLTQLRSDSRGNVRETDSNMVRVELRTVRPVPGHPSEEARLRAKLLPLRLYVDQDAVDFLKKFFSFGDPHSSSPEPPSNEGEAYIQLAEIFPIDLKLDYKPRRVDYRALKEGKSIELMNFFHFDGAEMTLRHITLAGVTGWPRLFEMLNDLWTPDVKATQLMEVISGVAPIRSVVNVGSGVADLILLPIAQYKKDGRIVRGVQKGATAFVKSTAIEAIRMGAKLATGTQVILEQAEGILGGQFEVPITAETLQMPVGDDFGLYESDDESLDLISKYAQQPADIKEGMQSAYKSLRRNLSSAAQTILAVPMEVYERSGNEGPVRSVIRAVPIAVLKPMIGASEAVSKTLLGLHNTLDPNIRHDNEAKYK
ncbi:hypothetical protein B0H34DRAFT_764867 [Crassisporium funariophilum]|nr:hypothetical protein B0H34DRAFT_764867 [Crassisporium funariophilum]